MIRPPQTREELTEHIEGYVQVAQSFSPEPLPGDTGTRLLRKLTTFPGYRSEHVRSAYSDGKQLGGYRIYERLLRVGVAHLATGCIGGVYTRAEARNRGIATALMHDAVAYARAHEYPFLLLNGIPRFYHRYGFCDVYDMLVQEIDRQAVLSLPESHYRVRLASMDDALGLLTLYNQHFGSYTGSFVRGIEQQTHWMHHLEPGKLFVAIDLVGQVRGYLFIIRAMRQSEYPLSDELATVLTILFPTGKTWVPASDWF